MKFLKTHAVISRYPLDVMPPTIVLNSQDFFFHNISKSYSAINFMFYHNVLGSKMQNRAELRRNRMNLVVEIFTFFLISEPLPSNFSSNSRATSDLKVPESVYWSPIYPEMTFQNSTFNTLGVRVM